MSYRDYDIVIIGAGIHGVGVAQAAAAKGYRVALLEQYEAGSGTSSRSSKLIHGGLRYLETAQFGLVRECLRERTILLQIAPDLVKLKPFYIPIYRTTVRRSWQIAIGLGLYYLLSGLSKDGRFKKLAPDQWSKLDGLQPRNLLTVYQYYDAQTDDQALTQAVLRSACHLGADFIHPATFLTARHDADGWSVNFRSGDGQEQQCRSRTLVNAAGPWVNQVLPNIKPTPPIVAIDLVQGAHILLNTKTTQGIYYIESPQDQRAIFVMPWQGKTLVGTTEHAYQGEPEKVLPLAEEKQYLLDAYKHYFSAQGQGSAEVLTAFAGLRVLPRSASSNFKRSRDTRLEADNTENPSLITIYGGKLTAYRATAQLVLKKLQASLPAPTKNIDTKDITLT